MKLGGPEVLRYEEVSDPKPAAGEALVKIEAAGVNFLDIYYRSGFHWGGHHRRPLPYIPGAEAAGTVVALGDGVNGVKVSDRVAYGISNGSGSYAELYNVPSWHLFRLPQSVDFPTAAAVMLQGMTAHYLTHSTYAVKPNDAVLVHAAAGGTGLLLVQIAKMLGARVIGTVSTDEKAELARKAGADATINYTQQDFAAEVRKLTGGKGVNVVYDSVGKDTYEKSLDSLRPLGMPCHFRPGERPCAAVRHRRTERQRIVIAWPDQASPTMSRAMPMSPGAPVICSAGSKQESSMSESAKTFSLSEAAEGASRDGIAPVHRQAHPAAIKQMYGWRAKIGRISPSPETVGCEEWRRAMPDGVCLVETRTLLHDVTVEGLAETVKQVERAALELASAEVDVILQAGTAIAFFRGFGHDQELSRRITAATGIKATTSLTAVVEALRVLGIKRPAIATSYLADIDARLADVLRQSDFTVAAIRGMGLKRSIDMGKVMPDETYRLAREVARSPCPMPMGFSSLVAISGASKRSSGWKKILICRS